MSIIYKTEYFDLIQDLTTIDKSIIFDREDDNVVVRRNDQEKTVAYILKAPVKYFDIDERIGLYDYVEFYRFLKTIENVNIIKKNNKLVLSNKSSKLNYLLSNVETMKTGPKKISFNDADFEFELDKDSLHELIKIHNTIKSRVATFSCKDNEITIKIFKDEEDNSFEKIFEAKNLSGIKESIDFDIFSDLFEKLPTKRDYTVSIKSPGYLKISLKDENINLNIFTGRTKN